MPSLDELTARMHIDDKTLPDPSFFDNFQMPFLSFEEIIVKDKNSSLFATPANPAQAFGFGSFRRNFHDQFRNQVRVQTSRGRDADGHSLSYSLLQPGHRPPVYDNRTGIQYAEAAVEISEGEADEDDIDIATNPNKLYSVFKITTDGKTPFDKEEESEIVYDRKGQPTEVVVYEGTINRKHSHELMRLGSQPEQKLFS